MTRLWHSLPRSSSQQAPEAERLCAGAKLVSGFLAYLDHEVTRR
jgi:hypothetical protein